VEKLVDLLNRSKIDRKKLRRILSKGIPDEAQILREYSWKLILSYLPEHKS
jgi:hypothetical protein